MLSIDFEKSFSGISFSGIVVAGNRIGRTIGFPTANIEPEGEAEIPSGVFACIVALPECPCSREAGFKGGMLNVGTRPTVGGIRRSIEANLFDYEGNLYGLRLKVFVLGRIREEKRFGSLELLGRQLEEDKVRAQRMIKAFLQGSTGAGLSSGETA